MVATPDSSRSNSRLYFSFTGFIISIVLAGVALADRQPGALPGSLYLVRELAVVGLASIAYVSYSAFGDRWRAKLQLPLWLYDAPIGIWFFAFAWTSWTLLRDEHNRFILVIALAQALLLQQSLNVRAKWPFVGLLVLAAMTWSLSVTIPFTPLKDWLVGASPATALSALAFSAAFFVVVSSLARSDSVMISVNAPRVLAYAAATFLFAAAAFRTDHLLFDWIPYHRSYFVDIANLVRDGHWLLWDAPSQYGFFSVLAIALFPSSNAWQSLYILTGIILTVQASITFTILYYGRRRCVDYALALLLPMATYLCASVTRFPFDARLYPQIGFRFIWTVLLIFIAFQIYVNRANRPVVRAITISGYATWTLSVLWSFETAVWGTIVWLTYVITNAIVDISRSHEIQLGKIGTTLVARLLPFPILAASVIFAVEIFYKLTLGHGPDLISYFEFSAVYAADPNYHMAVDRRGPAWTLLLILGALGSIGVVAARERRLEALPLIATAWIAAWATTSYWVGEAFNSHVIGVYSVAIPAAAVTIFLSREQFAKSDTATFARLSVIPLVTILIAMTLGDPADALKIKIPFLLGGNGDSTSDFPPVSGELAALIQKASIQPSDRVIFPTSVGWTKIDTGWILPFARLPDGSVSEYHSWLPISPQGAYNTIESLDLDRRRTYIDRNLNTMKGSGWYITYREPGNCSIISPRLITVRSVSTVNFTASLCRMR
jgi:hypothetical protein